MASKAVGLLTFNFGANMKGFEKAMNKAQKKLKRFGKSMTKAGKSMTVGLTLPILGLAAAALKFGSDLEETNAKFLTVFSSMQKEAEETAKVFKDSFGLSELAAKEMLSGTGDLLVGIGLTESGALDLSTKINELAVDLASFTNFSGGAKGASDALTKALLGERESIKSLGISINEADLKEFAADQGLVWKELDKGTRAMLTYELAAQQSFKAIGDFERTSGSFANQLRIVKGDLVDVASEMGARLIPHAQAAIEKFKGLIKWFDGLSDSQKDSIVKWGLILAAIGPVLIIIGKMSLGIGALIKVTKGLIANPWLVVAAAVVILAKAVYDYTTTLRGAEKAKKSLLDVEVEAFANAKEEERQLKNKLILARDVTKSDEERKVAIATLNNTLVGLNGTLNLENIAEVNVTNAINKHTEALINQAKIAGTQALISEAYGELMRTSKDATRALDDLNLIEKANEATAGLFQLLVSPLTGQTMDDVMKERGGNIVTSYVKGINEEMDFYQAAIDKLVEATPTAETIKPILGGTGELIDDLDELTDGTKKLVEPLEVITLSLEEFSDEATTLEKVDFENVFSTDPMDKFRGALGILGDEIAMFIGKDVKEMEEGIVSVMDKIEGNLAQGADSFEEYGKTVKQIAREEIGALISTGIAAAVKNAMTSIPPFPGSVFLIPILAAAAGGLARTAFNSLIPSFAEGGLVTGPTTALIGEGAGTSMANPEVVAPLDSLKSMMGGGSQNITVTGKLIGNDIFLSNAKTGINRLRTT